MEETVMTVEKMAECTGLSVQAVEAIRQAGINTLDDFLEKPPCTYEGDCKEDALREIEDFYDKMCFRQYLKETAHLHRSEGEVAV